MMTTRVKNFVRGGKIHRDFGYATLALTTSEGTSDPIDIRLLSTLQIHPAAGITSITWYGCETDAGTFVLIQDAGTAGVQTVTADKWNQVPAAVASHGFVKAVANSAGNATISGKT
jgi:hypothetical protein